MTQGPSSGSWKSETVFLPRELTGRVGVGVKNDHADTEVVGYAA